MHPLAFIVYDKYYDILESIYSQEFNKMSQRIFMSNLYQFILNKNNSVYSAIMQKFYETCKKKVEIDFIVKYGKNNLANYSREIESSTQEHINEIDAQDIKIKVIKSKLFLYETFLKCNFITQDSLDTVLSTEQFKTIQSIYKSNKKEDFFFNQFDKLLLPVKAKDLESFEKYINDKNHKINMTSSQLQEINYLIYSLQRMNDNNITSANYDKKVVSAYKSLKDNAFENFGIVLSERLPFENPSSLVQKIDKILYNCNFTGEQKRIFFKEFLNRKQPTQNHIDEEKLKRLRLLYDSLSRMERYYILHEVEKPSVLCTILALAKMPQVDNFLSIDFIKFISELYKFSDIARFKQHLEENIDMIDEQTSILNEHLLVKVREERLAYEKRINNNIHKLFLNPNNIKSEISSIIDLMKILGA